MVAAAVNLEGDPPTVGMSLLVVLVFHEPNAVDPGDDLRRVADDTALSSFHWPCRQKGRPLSWDRWVSVNGASVGLISVGLSPKSKLARQHISGESLAEDAHQVAFRMIVDQSLISRPFSVLRRKRPLSGPKSLTHFQNDFEVSKGLIGQDDPTVARLILTSDDGSSSTTHRPPVPWPVWLLTCQPWSVLPSKMVLNPRSSNRSR